MKILCLEQPVPWTGFCHPEPGVREGASGPCSGFANLGMKSQSLWLTLSAEYWLLPNAGTKLSLVKNVFQERGQCWGTQAQQLDCLHFNLDLPTVTLAKWSHYSEPKDLKQYLAHNQQSKPWHLWSWCVLLFIMDFPQTLKGLVGGALQIRWLLPYGSMQRWPVGTINSAETPLWWILKKAFVTNFRAWKRCTS